ncbi:uncharacterized protein KGF55_003952 [Candida pseudojiufengensis]|uniref:uncharacterized protein n=1 Tax=Candida pseudojiufengensis TaxID=497109 RepID=UPI00222588CF|nr:uncharacterized protein KGF55_003952 [Candida pseudojiufengensis]KAI5961635.1 hypothetical protein KGF55_003952 [Candida pseudojiufengensis]
MTLTLRQEQAPGVFQEAIKPYVDELHKVKALVEGKKSIGKFKEEAEAAKEINKDIAKYLKGIYFIDDPPQVHPGAKAPPVDEKFIIHGTKDPIKLNKLLKIPRYFHISKVPYKLWGQAATF